MHIFKEIQNFFEEYKNLENKTVKVNSWGGAEEALKVVKESFDFYRREEQKLRGWG